MIKIGVKAKFGNFEYLTCLTADLLTDHVNFLNVLFRFVDVFDKITNKIVQCIFEAFSMLTSSVLLLLF